MTVAVLWLRQNELVLGELSEQDGTFCFSEIAATEASFPLEPMLAKSEIATRALNTHLLTLFSAATPTSIQIEVWLPWQWGVVLTIPTPSLPEKEVIEQISWEASKQLQTDLDYYLYLYRDRGDGRYAVKLMRPAVVSFWKKVLSDSGYELAAVRLANPDEPVADIVTFDFKSLTVAGSEEIHTDHENMHEALFTRKLPSKKLLITVAAVIVVICISVFFFTVNPISSPRRSQITQPVTPKTTQTNVPAPAIAKKDTTVQPTAPVVLAASVPVTLFTGIVESLQKTGKLELASMIPGEAVFQCISGQDNSESVKTVWRERSGKPDALKTKYDAATNRLTVWIVFPGYKPDDAFMIPPSDKITLDGMSATASANDLLAAISKWQTLPYRISLLPDGNNLRLVVVK